MNKAQKQVQQAHLDEEKKVIKLLQIVYNQAKKDCEQKIRELSARTDLENLQSIVYQKQYQEVLKKQLEGVLDDLHSKQFTSIADYLSTCYTNGFVGNMYDLQSQGVLIMIPIQQDQVVQAVQTDSAISEGLYSKLGEDTAHLKKSIRAELSRGVANGSSWNEVAVLIARGMNSPFKKAYNNAIRITRTEGHRIQNKAALDAQYHAKEKGADIVKQWDSTLDGRTRPEHREVDGQIRELDEPFDVGGEKMEAPGVGGSARNVCNCRCCLLQRARRELNDGFTKKDNFTSELRSFSSPEDYDEFKKWYFSKENTEYMNYVNVLEKRYGTKDFNKLLEKMTDGEYNHFRKLETATPMYDVNLHQKNRGKKVNITEQAIQKVNIIQASGLTEENKLFITDVHKKLLMYAKDENDSNEVAGLVKLEDNTSTNFIKGGRHEVDIYSDSDTYHLLRTSKQNSLVLCHNHPGLTDFSANDINVFMKNESLKIITIVDNQGNVKYLSKTEKFHLKDARKLMLECIDDCSENRDKIIEKFLKKCYSVGIERK